MDPQDPSLGHGHGLIQTTSNTLEPAPEVLLTRSCDKRSFAALEPEFVDSNDINGMAPASAVLQSDHLVIDDEHNLDEKFDMSGRVILTTAPSNTTQPPVPKRTRLSPDDVRPSASDFAQLQPIIQPDSKREPGDQYGHHHRHIHTREQPAKTHSLSRRRSIADLVPPSSQRAPVNVDEPEATVVYGEPMDSSSTALALADSEDEDPSTPALTTQYPGSKRAAASGSSPKPAPEVDQHQDNERRFNPMRRPSGLSSGNSGNNSRQNSIPQDPRHSASSKAASTLFMPASHSSGPLDQRRSSITSLRKAPQRPVRIQILDEAESEKIMERSRHDALNEEPLLSQQSSQAFSQDPYRSLALDDGDADIALPKEDPIVHDWDEEELEDEESGTSTPTATTGTSTPQFLTSDAYSSSMNDRAFTSTEAQQQRKRNDDDDDDNDDRDQDILCDPEREIAVMSESQEANLHNMHVRLENQREFQDAAGLDLGEDDAQALNEDGRYGGAIEDDDEGDDYWGNR